MFDVANPAGKCLFLKKEVLSESDIANLTVCYIL